MFEKVIGENCFWAWSVKEFSEHLYIKNRTFVSQLHSSFHKICQKCAMQIFRPVG